MRIKRYLGLFLVALVSVFALGLANKDVKAETEWDYQETFDNAELTSSYSDGSFVDENNITWSYVASRDENGDANNSGIVGKAIMLRRSSDDSKITSSTISGGISNFSVKLYKGFTGRGDRQVELFINGVSQGTSDAFDDFDEHIFTVDNINIAGDFTIEIRNITSNQVIIDDISWNSSQKPETDITATVNQLFDSTNPLTTEVSAEYGQDVVVPVEAEDFQFALVNGFIREDFVAGNNNLPITEGLEVNLVYAKDNHAVLFLDSNGKLISYTWVTDGEDVAAPATANLSKPGYKLSDTPWLSNEGHTSLKNIDSSRVYRLQYELEEINKVNITVGEDTTEYNYNEIVTLTATKEDFKAWVDEKGNVLSTNETFKFTALLDRKINESTNATLPTTPIITMTNDLELREGMQTFLGQLELRDGDTLVEHGLVVTNDGFLRDKELTLANGTKAKSNVLVPATNEFLLSIGEDYLVVIAFVTVRNAEGIIETFYSNNQYDDVAIVTFDTDGGNEIDPVAVKAGTAVLKPADPERPSHEFLGWFVGETAFDFATLINEDTIIIAKWQEVLPTIAEVRELEVGTETEFVGIVTGIDGDNLFVQDETAAIYVYQANLPEGLKVGDEVRIQGTRADFSGLDQIAYGARVTIETVGDKSFPIHDFTKIDELTNSLQSQRFNLENLVIVSQSGRELVLSDGVDNIVIYTPASGAIYNHIQRAIPGLKVDALGAFVGWRFENPQITIIDTNQLVFLEPTDLDKVTLAAEELTIAGVAGVEGITLPNTGLYEVNISWSSSNPSVISNDGNVTLPTEETTVIMTATISLNTEQTTKTFDVVVHPEGQAEGETFVETFDDMTLSGTSYGSGSHTGINSQKWSYTDARGDQKLNDSKALLLRNGSLTTTFTSGLSHISFDYDRAFTGSSARSYEIYINDILIDTITVNANKNELKTYTSGILNYVGNVTLEIKGIGAQKMIDNVSWTTNPN